MHALTAQTAAPFLGAGAHHRPGPQTEAAYYATCVEEEAQRQGRAASERWRTRILTWFAARRLRQENRIGMARLLRSDPHMLRDMGIEFSPFGTLVIEEGPDRAPRPAPATSPLRPAFAALPVLTIA